MNYFRKVIEGMAIGSLCCVANAYHLHEMKEVPCSEELAHCPLPENDLILLVIVGVKDPCGTRRPRSSAAMGNDLSP